MVKTALFAWVAIAYVGGVWQLWVGTALFVVPAICENSLLNLPRWLPQKLIKVVIMLVVAKLAAAVLLHSEGDPAGMISDELVDLAIPGVILSVLANFGREGEPWRLTWTWRILGAALIAVGIMIVLGVIAIA